MSISNRNSSAPIRRAHDETPRPLCFERYTSNIYVRRTLAGEFVCVSKHLLNDLIKLDLWDENMKNKIIASNGSIQNIDEIPDNIKQLYKTVWEISQKVIVNMAADREDL